MKRPTSESNIFYGVPPLAVSDPEPPESPPLCGGGAFLSRSALRAMPREQLAEYAEALQNECRLLDGENKFLSWESQSGLAFFSRAAKLAHDLNSSSIDTVVDVAVDEVAGFFDCGFAALFLHKPESGRFELARASRDAAIVAAFAEREEFLSKLFLSRAESYIVDFDVESGCLVFEDGERFECDIPEGWAETVSARALVFPLRAVRTDSSDPRPVQRVLGGLILGCPAGNLEGRDADAAQFFAELLSASLHNAQLVEMLNVMTIVDPLTNIYNRRHLLNQLDASMNLADRHGHALCIAILDIDFFKRFNDDHGHLCGDEVLRTVAGILKNSLRIGGGDLPARYGGEEFLVVMPFTPLERAVEAAERLRERIRDHRIRFDDADLGITCSFGVAQYAPGECLERLIDRADAALYTAKRNGRDRVVAAPP